MKLLKALGATIIIMLVIMNVFAAKLPNINDDLTNGQSGSDSLKILAGGTWATIILIAQILAIAAITFAGIRYMFAAADQKAEIKKSVTVLTVGAILVFGATVILRFIIESTEELLL